MANDTKYQPIPWLYDSIGLHARENYDRCPPNSYIQMMNVLERNEHTVSSRYGYTVINRSPDRTIFGSNFYFTSPVVSLAKVSYEPTGPQRYAALADGTLWQRNSNLQGNFTELPLPSTITGQPTILSGSPFTSLILPCFETSLPFLFIADQAASIKIAAGSSTPELWGIDPPPNTLNVLPYAPLLIMIDNFSASNSYVNSGMSSWGWGTIETLSAQSGQLITDFSQFYAIGSGGTAIYLPFSPTDNATVTTPIGGGTNTGFSVAIFDFPSVVPPAGEVVTLHLEVGGSASVAPPFMGGGAIQFQYSTDAGATWTTFFAFSTPGTSQTFPTQAISTTVPGISNLALLYGRIFITVGGSPSNVTTLTGNIFSAYASISNPGAFGPIANGMVALLNNNKEATIPILNVTSAGQSPDGLYTQLLVQTIANHPFTASDTMGIYASSNDLVDGFYEIQQVTASNAFLIPFLSATQIGAAGGYVTYAADSASNYQPLPPACVLSNQYSTPYPSQMSAWGFYEWVPPTTSSFPISAWSGTIASASSTATVKNTANFDLNQNNQVTDSDLIVVTLLTSAPENIAQIELRFFVGSGTNNYYSGFISPAYYQGAVAGNILAYQATQQQILADSLGLITGQPPNTTTSQLQPTNISTGSGSWQACLIPRGNFLPVGQAGQAGLDWSNVTGWELLVTTNSNGGASFSVNGIYLQWGYGPSSFGGIGYDWRQTFYNANTGTESSPSPEQAFNKDFGYLASTSAPFFLRQAAQVTGYYSPDPQDTHVRLYRRGGILGANWVQTVQAPNIPAGGQFTLKDVIADAFILQAQPLVLDNDPPVTSSLVTPIQTTLAAPTTLTGLSSIYSTFSPQLVPVADASAVFTQNMLVEVGNASNLELVAVIQGGTGQFTAILRLQHNQGEPVSVYAIPRQPCSLCCIVNLPGGATQVLLSGDENNPGRVYFSKPNQPENFGPQNYLDAGSATDPVMALINWRGTALVVTQATWLVFVGGAQPYLQPTGATHGIVASGGWILAEGTIPFRAADGWREFSGADGIYMTLPVEWIFRTNPECLPPQADQSAASQDVFAYYNNLVLGSYVSVTASNTAGPRYRLIWDTQYKRYRQDDIAATAMLWERDTNLLVCGIPVETASNGIQYAVVADQQYNQDYDDGGWLFSGGGIGLVKKPINLTIQRPYNDLGKPHFPKQWNMLEGDYNTQTQDLETTLLFNTEPPLSISLPPANTGSRREKVEFQIPAVLTASNALAEGVQAYSMSILHTMAVTTAPTLYQENIYAAVLADFRSSFDTYWQKAGIDELKLWKEGYFDYTTTEPVVFSLYRNGDMSHPYYQFTLPVQTDRAVVRVLFPALKSRLWRMIGTSIGDFQLWAPVVVDSKPILEGSGYERVTYGVYE